MLNLYVKILSKWYSKKCYKCNTTHIDAILNSFKEKNFCPKCKKQINIGEFLLKIFLIYTKLNIDDLIDLSSDKQAIAIINALFRGISKHGLKIIRTGIPVYVVFDITNKCNLKCIHCYSSTKDGDLTTNDVHRIINLLYEMGAGIIDFGGGEPLLRNDIFNILSYSKDIGLYTSISTNSLRLSDNNIKRLKKLKIDHICISLDGAKPETHDYIRNKKGAYKKTINSIKNCVNSGINTQISTVFMKSNINELLKIYNLIKSLNVNGWYVYDFIPGGRGINLKDELLNPIQRQQLFTKLEELAVSNNLSIKPYPYAITINSVSRKDAYFYKKYGKLTEFFKGCLAARWVCHISSNGDLNPCHLLPHKLANLKEENFENVWFNNTNIVLKELRNRKLLKGNCGICRYKDVCGGCRAKAFWTTGDYLENDDCWIKN